MKRAKRLGLLAGVLVVVSALAFGVLHYQEQTEQIRASGETVLEVDSAAVEEFSWEYQSHDPLSFHRDEEGNWVYDEDSAFPVDGGALDSLLEQFRSFGAAFTIEDVTDLGQYGLDEPICTVRFTAGDTDYEILLGNYSTMDTQRYVSIGDGNVYLAVNDPLSSFDVTIRDLIDNDEVPSFGTVTALTLDGTETLQITRQEYTEGSTLTYCADDLYYLERDGSRLPLDTDRVESYLRALEGLALTDYKTYQASQEDLSVYGLDDPELTVTVTDTPADSEDGESRTFTLEISRDPAEAAEAAASDGDTGSDGEETITAYARVAGSEIVYQISGTSYETLMAAGYDDLRHTELFTGSEEQVTGLDITLDGAEYTLTADGDGEDRVFLYDGEEADTDTLFRALEALTAEDFTDEQPTQKEEISLTIHLDSESFPEVQLTLYRYDGQSCLAVVNSTPWALVSRESVVDLIEAVNAIVL